MHLRQVKGDMRLLIIPEPGQFCLYLFIIQETEFVFPHFYTLGDAGVFVQAIIITKIILVQYLEHYFAAFTAKCFFIDQYFTGRAGFTAVIALYFFFGEIWGRHSVQW